MTGVQTCALPILKMAWEYSTFGYSGDRDMVGDDNIIVDANSGLSLTNGPELMITAVLSSGKEVDNESEDKAQQALDKALEAEQERTVQETLFRDNIATIKGITEGGVQDKDVHNQIYGDNHHEKKMYNDFGALKTEGKIGRRRVGKECRSRWSPYH